MLRHFVAFWTHERTACENAEPRPQHEPGRDRRIGKATMLFGEMKSDDLGIGGLWRLLLAPLRSCQEERAEESFMALGSF